MKSIIHCQAQNFLELWGSQVITTGSQLNTEKQDLYVLPKKIFHLSDLNSSKIIVELNGRKIHDQVLWGDLFNPLIKHFVQVDYTGGKMPHSCRMVISEEKYHEYQCSSEKLQTAVEKYQRSGWNMRASAVEENTFWRMILKTERVALGGPYRSGYLIMDRWIPEESIETHTDTLRELLEKIVISILYYASDPIFYEIPLTDQLMVKITFIPSEDLIRMVESECQYIHQLVI